MLQAVMPGYQGMFNQMGANVASELAGQVPADVQNQIQRFGAQQTITSGIGGGGAGIAGAGFGLTDKTITARDLGLTSLNLMQQGQAGLGSMLSMARNYLMPQLATPQTMLPLADLVAGQQWTDQAVFEANLAAYNASLASAQAAAGQVPTQSQLTGTTGQIGGLLQGLGQTSPQTGQTGYSMLGNLFNFGGGGGQVGSGSMDQLISGLGLGGVSSGISTANFGY